ncbi:hypothetical protein TNCV_594271 [Trichonephila clavipes]|nr:hypothetical protein TNCV_594271 [Trichonephila clavipes]
MVLKYFSSGIFFVVMDQDPGAFGGDEQKAMREAVKRRYTLNPYLYTLFYHVQVHGDTVVRPLFHECVFVYRRFKRVPGTEPLAHFTIKLLNGQFCIPWRISWCYFEAIVSIQIVTIKMSYHQRPDDGTRWRIVDSLEGDRCQVQMCRERINAQHRV